MTQIIQIKRSTTTVAPSTLAQGELAYSDQTSKLFIGSATNGTILTIGGKIYVDMLDHTAGVLTASSAIVVDSNKKIDNLIVDNIDLNGNTISSTTGNLVLSPSSNLVINSSSVDISAQATEFKVLDGSSTAFTISEDTNNYITIDTTNSSEKIVFNKNELKSVELFNKKKKKSKDQIVEFQKDEMHTFSEWLTVSKFKPIDRNSKKKEENILNKFISSNHKITPNNEIDENYDLDVVYEDNHNNLMTETLAKLYLSQKNYEKAIQSYKILSLKFPKKSSYFADQIKKIKKIKKSN